MKSSFKFIYLIGIVVVIIIIVTLGLFVMKSSQDFTNSADLSLSDTNEFNNIWLGYKGKQKGSTVQRMVQKVISNANENSNNPAMLVDITYKIHGNDEFSFISSTKKVPNVDNIKALYTEISDTHYYTIDFVYSKNKQISGIIIKYAEKDKVDFVPDEN